MKLRYFIPCFFAGVSLFLSCDKNDEKTFLDGLRLSQSYVTIDAEGGQATITIDAAAEWTFDFYVEEDADSLSDETGVVKYKELVPQMQLKKNKWVNVTPSEGGAGTTQVKFTADSTADTREVVLRVKMGDQYQYVNILQMSTAEVPASTVKDVLNGVDSKTYRVKGSVSAIVSTTYGNWYLSDEEGNKVYVYGTLDKKGKTKSNPLDDTENGWNIELGDVVTIEGPRTTYNGTIELVDVTVLKVEKALLKSKNAQYTIEKSASTFELAITQKGEGLKFSSDCDWLTFEGNGYDVKDGNLVFMLSSKENTTGNIRTGNVIFESNKDKDRTKLIIPVKQLGLEFEPATLASLSANIAPASKPNPYRFCVELQNAKVTYKSGSNFFLEDVTGGLLVYNSDLKLEVGQVINGKVYGSGYGYNNLAEATDFSTELATIEKGETPSPTVITLDELTANYDKYISRYVRVENVTVTSPIDVVYSKVKSKGAISDGTNTFDLNHQSSGKYNGKNIYYYLNVAQGSKVSFTCIPSVYKDNKQLNIWTSDWFK